MLAALVMQFPIAALLLILVTREMHGVPSRHLVAEGLGVGGKTKMARTGSECSLRIL